MSHHNIIHSANIRSVSMLPPEAVKFVTYYASLTSVRAIATIGSLASGQSDRHSDIDIVIICENSKLPSTKKRMGMINYISQNTAHINTFNLKTRLFGISDDFIINNNEICTQFFTKKDVDDAIGHIKSGFYQQQGMEYPLAFLNSILTANVHIDKDRCYEKLKKKVRPFPKTLQKIILTKERELHLPYYLKRLEVAIARGDVPYAHKMINSSIDSVLYIIFAHHMRYPHGPKRLYEQLSSFLDKDTYIKLTSYLDELFYTNTTSLALVQKLDALKGLSKLVGSPQDSHEV